VDPDAGTAQPGYRMRMHNVTRVCDHYVSLECIQKASEDMCTAQLINQLLEGKPADTIWQPQTIAGVVVGGECGCKSGRKGHGLAIWWQYAASNISNCARNFSKSPLQHYSQHVGRRHQHSFYGGSLRLSTLSTASQCASQCLYPCACVHGTTHAVLAGPQAVNQTCIFGACCGVCYVCCMQQVWSAFLLCAP